MEYKKAERLNPNDPEVHFRIGKDLETRGKLQEALEKYQAVKELDDTNPEVYYRCGKLYQRLEQPEQAIAEFARIVGLKPDWLENRYELATLYGEKGAFEEQIKGSIEVGKLADLVVLGADPTAVPPLTIKDIPVERTLVGGEVVYES